MISVIATVLNEGDHIHRLMRSLKAQDYPADEIVIVDGGSRDSTVRILEAYQAELPLRILVEPGCNISQGRNRAIAAAQGDIIAVTDAGVELRPNWLREITRPLRENPGCAVVGGFFHAQAATRFELAMGATVLPLEDEIQAESFLPSSRSVAFRKPVWERVGGYPEWLDYCEDLIFDLRLKQVASPFAFAPNAAVEFRPRGSLRSFFKQYYLYARGDGKADLWRKRHAIRYLTYLVALPLLLLLGAAVHPLLWLLLIPGAFIYLRQPYRRLRTLLRREQQRHTPAQIAYLVALVPVIRVVGDVAKMLGYPVGWWWRLRNHPPDWRRV
ncbi:MAG: glycosyltransferase [Anaerolineae bacterium]|nr:glycosyltransferase [Anaerolineae bacterium]